MHGALMPSVCQHETQVQHSRAGRAIPAPMELNDIKTIPFVHKEQEESG